MHSLPNKHMITHNPYPMASEHVRETDNKWTTGVYE